MILQWLTAARPKSALPSREHRLALLKKKRESLKLESNSPVPNIIEVQPEIYVRPQSANIQSHRNKVKNKGSPPIPFGEPARRFSIDQTPGSGLTFQSRLGGPTRIAAAETPATERRMFTLQAIDQNVEFLSFVTLCLQLKRVVRQRCGHECVS